MGRMGRVQKRGQEGFGDGKPTSCRQIRGSECSMILQVCGGWLGFSCLYLYCSLYVFYFFEHGFAYLIGLAYN